MNLDDYEGRFGAQNAGFTVEIVDPLTKQPTGLKIMVCGPDTRTFYVAKNAARREAVKAGVGDSDDIVFDATALMVSKCILGWEGLTKGGKPVEFAPHKAVSLFKKFPWVMEQCDNAISNRENFTAS